MHHGLGQTQSTKKICQYGPCLEETPEVHQNKSVNATRTMYDGHLDDLSTCYICPNMVSIRVTLEFT
jgi:hypothetical protein